MCNAHISDTLIGLALQPPSHLNTHHGYVAIIIFLSLFVSWFTFKPLVFHLLGSIGNCKMDNSTLAIPPFPSHSQNGNGIENWVRSMPCYLLINWMMLLTRSKMPSQNFVTGVDITGGESVFNSLEPADCLVTAWQQLWQSFASKWNLLLTC